jgi:hypothetical protein
VTIITLFLHRVGEEAQRARNADAQRKWRGEDKRRDGEGHETNQRCFIFGQEVQWIFYKMILLKIVSHLDPEKTIVRNGS